jgi:hypothetical protein
MWSQVSGAGKAGAGRAIGTLLHISHQRRMKKNNNMVLTNAFLALKIRL